MNKNKVKHHRKSDTKTANKDHIRTTALERSVMNYWGLKLVLCAQPKFIPINTHRHHDGDDNAYLNFVSLNEVDLILDNLVPAT